MSQDLQRDIKPNEEEQAGAGSQLALYLYCAIAFPIFLYACFVLREMFVILVCSPFAVFGVVAIFRLITISASLKKFGDLRLLLGNPLPSVGGRLNATLRLSEKATAAPFTLHANLVCNTLEYDKKGAGTETPLRGVRMAIQVPRTSDGATVRIACTIPGDLPPTSEPGPQGGAPSTKYANWELTLNAEVDGADLVRTYAIKVAPMLPGTVWHQPEAPAAAPPPAIAIPKAALAEAASPAAEPALPADGTSLWVLVAVNLVPLAGVMFWGWRVHEIVFLYWIENLVIGAGNVLRIRVAVPEAMPDLAKRGIDVSPSDLGPAKVMLAAFFLGHYGGFCFIHGEILASMFPAVTVGSQVNSLGSVIGSMLSDPRALVAIIAIVVSHAYSYFHDYIGRREYQHVGLAELMIRPYKRVGVTHIFVIVGGIALSGIQRPVLAIAIFVALKICFDAGAHRMERSSLSADG